MPHPNETLIRTMYAAFAVGDMPGVLACCTEDAVFKVPGNSRVAGQYVGHDGFLTGMLPVLSSIADMSTFRETIDALACDDDHGVLFTTQSFQRLDGREVSYRSGVIFQFRNGLMSEFLEHAGNQAEYDDAWA